MWREGFGPPKKVWRLCDCEQPSNDHRTAGRLGLYSMQGTFVYHCIDIIDLS